MHGMHSVVDWLCFAVWEDGRLIRSLSLSPDGGIQENIGEPFAFELPYWAGEHPVEPVPGWPDHGPILWRSIHWRWARKPCDRCSGLSSRATRAPKISMPSRFIFMGSA